MSSMPFAHMPADTLYKKQRMKKQVNIDSPQLAPSEASTDSTSPEKKKRLFFGRAKSVRGTSTISSIGSDTSHSWRDIHAMRDMPLHDGLPSEPRIMTLPNLPLLKSESQANPSIAASLTYKSSNPVDKYSVASSFQRSFTSQSDTRPSSPDNIYADIIQNDPSAWEGSQSHSLGTPPQDWPVKAEKKTPGLNESHKSGSPSTEQQSFWQTSSRLSGPVIARQPSRGRGSRTISQSRSVRGAASTYQPNRGPLRSRVALANKSSPHSTKSNRIHRARSLNLTPRKRLPLVEKASAHLLEEREIYGDIGLGIQLVGATYHEERPAGRLSASRRSTNEAGHVSRLSSRRILSKEPKEVESREEDDIKTITIVRETAQSRPVAAHLTIVPDREIDTEQLIEELLEENYRGQAETFVRTRSRSSSLKTPPMVATAAIQRSATLSALSFETPTRRGKNESFAASQRSASAGISLKRKFDYQTDIHAPPESSRTPGGRIVIEPYKVLSTPTRSVGLSPQVPRSPQTYGHRIYQLPDSESPVIVKKQRKNIDRESFRGLFWFTAEENIAIREIVNSQQYSCYHENCNDCRELEFSFLENKAMPTSIPPEDRQKIINNNRSLRNIKNELENLAENNALEPDVFDQIMSLLPSESSLNSSSRVGPSPVPPTAALSNMQINNSPPPPAYTTPAAPSLPNRQPSAPPRKPVLHTATALYRYAEPEDCNFEVGDTIEVNEHMNADWWFGRNTRTGKEGVFPVNYVQAQTAPSPSPYGAYGNEKANGYGAAQSQGPPPPGPSNPYNSSVPPMAIAGQPTQNGEPGKGAAMGKKFGKKLGNAAIFGAGATIGGNIVNSIF